MPATPALTVDVKDWPLVYLTYVGEPTLAELEKHLREIEAKVLVRDEPFVQILDVLRGVMPDVRRRSLIAEHQARSAEAYGRNCRGEVYIATPEFRGAMTAVFWQEKPPYPYAFVASRSQAVAWAQERLAP